MRNWTWVAPSMALGASLLVGSFLGSATPATASTIEGGGVVEGGVVECGTEFSVRPIIDPNTFELKRWWQAPEGSCDDEVAALLADQTALFKLLTAELIAEARNSGQLYDLACEYCEIPNRCRIWATGWSPPPQVNFYWYEAGPYIIVAADLQAPLTLTVSCTGC